MISKVLSKVFGSRNDRTVKRLRKAVEQITIIEPEFEKLRDEELRAKTDEFRKRLEDGAGLESLLPEAFVGPTH